MSESDSDSNSSSSRNSSPSSRDHITDFGKKINDEPPAKTCDERKSSKEKKKKSHSESLIPQSSSSTDSSSSSSSSNEGELSSDSSTSNSDEENCKTSKDKLKINYDDHKRSNQAAEKEQTKESVEVTSSGKPQEEQNNDKVVETIKNSEENVFGDKRTELVRNELEKNEIRILNEENKTFISSAEGNDSNGSKKLQNMSRTKSRSPTKSRSRTRSKSRDGGSESKLSERVNNKSSTRSLSRETQLKQRSTARGSTRSRSRSSSKIKGFERRYERRRSASSDGYKNRKSRRSESLERRREERKRRHAERDEQEKAKRLRRDEENADRREIELSKPDRDPDKNKAFDNVTVTDPEAKITEMQRKTVDLLTSRTGGAYIPPAKLRLMQAEITDKASAAYQRIAWEALKKSIHGYINKVNVDNIAIITRELLKENIVRGRGLLCRSIIQAQAASPTFTHVYAALVSIINSKFPNIGELLLKRLVIQFKRAFRRNDKAVCLSSSRFIAHLVNQRVAHEILALEILTLLVESPTDDSVEVAIAFLKECGMKLTEVSSKGIGAIFEMLKNILHEGKLDKRVQYMIEVVFQVRKDGFKDHLSVIESLELVEEDDQFTHLLMLDDATNTEDMLNAFKFDEEYAANEEKYKGLSKEILGSDVSDSDGSSSGSGSESDSDSSDSDEAEKGEGKAGADDIIDNTETNLIALRRTIYLTINSSLDYEECAHKLMKMQLKPGQEIELCHMFLDCCAEQRTYEKFYGLLAQRFCSINKIYIEPFEEIFRDTYQTTHRLDTNRLRNVSKFFAHLLFTDAISWDVLECIKLNEDDTTSSSRIFIKILFQELAEYMGLSQLNKKLKDEVLVESLAGLFPKDNPRNTRFSINFFTSIGLGGLTDELRQFLKNAPKSVPAINAEILANKPVNAESSSSSSSSTSSSSSDSSSESSSSGSSSNSDSDSEVDRKKGKRRKRKNIKKMSSSKNRKLKQSKNNLKKANKKRKKSKKQVSSDESSTSGSDSKTDSESSSNEDSDSSSSTNSSSSSSSSSSGSSDDDKRKSKKKNKSKIKVNSSKKLKKSQTSHESYKESEPAESKRKKKTHTENVFDSKENRRDSENSEKRRNKYELKNGRPKRIEDQRHDSEVERRRKEREKRHRESEQIRERDRSEYETKTAYIRSPSLSQMRDRREERKAKEDRDRRNRDRDSDRRRERHRYEEHKSHVSISRSRSRSRDGNNYIKKEREKERSKARNTSKERG